jgi:hypothetical protein
MTLEERLAIAREISRRTKRRFVEDHSREEVKMGSLSGSIYALLG